MVPGICFHAVSVRIADAGEGAKEPYILPSSQVHAAGISVQRSDESIGSSRPLVYLWRDIMTGADGGVWADDASHESDCIVSPSLFMPKGCTEGDGKIGERAMQDARRHRESPTENESVMQALAQQQTKNPARAFLMMAAFNVVAAIAFIIFYFLYKNSGGEDSYFLLVAGSISGVAAVALVVVYNTFKKKF